MMLGSDSSLFLLELVWQQLWIGIVLVLFVSGGLCFAKRLNAATRHWIWALTLLTLMLLPLASLLPEAAVPQDLEYEFSQQGTPAPSGAVRAAEESVTDAGAEATQPRSRALVAGFGDQIRSSQGVRWLASSLLALWCAGTLCMFLGLVRGARTAAKLRRESAPAPIRSNLVDIRLTAGVGSPMVVGLRHPCILIPSALFDEIPRPELQRILDHELAHVRRGDHWMMLLQRFIEAVWFFHPAVRFAARRLDLEREISCDDRAALDRRNSYADSLVRLCRTMLTAKKSAPLAVGAVQSQSQLAQRVRCLLDRHRSHAPDVSRTGIAMSSFLLVGALALAMEWMPRLAAAEELPLEFGSPLIEAAATGDLEMLRDLIDAGADVNESVISPEPRTALNAAARHGHLAAVKILLDAGAEVDKVARGDATALIDAARGGHVDVVELLIERGAVVDHTVRGDGTALIAAARNAREDVVRLLLENGADPDRGVRGEGSPLAAASRSGSAESVALLIAAGADANIMVKGDAGAMMQAAARDDVALLEQLAAAGADLNHWTPGDGTPLIAAARRGKLAAAQWLLDNGADVNLAARGDGNPLILAAANGHLDLVRLLLDRGANIDAVVPGDETALITSARVGAVESVRLLLERGADVELAVPSGGLFDRTEVRTALNQAQSGGHEDIAALLVSHGARR